MELKFGILGGDYRYKILKDLIAADGYETNIYGCVFANDNVEAVDELVEKSNIIIGSIPCSVDEKLFSTGYGEVRIEDLFYLMNKNKIKIFIGGVVKPYIKQEAAKYSVKTFDFFDIEEVSVRNAVPTAEGAIMTAMKESERTIFGSKCLVIGYGRCGKMLAKDLNGLGARVTVTYRKEGDGAYIESWGMTALNFKDIRCGINSYDFIFNTVPAVVLDGDLLKIINRKTVIIDIAQAPGGVDYSLASVLNIKTVYCPGLPGRCAPMTAAEILKKAALDIALLHNT